MAESRLPSIVDSSSVGDPASFVAFDELERRQANLLAAPLETGRVTLLVRRMLGGLRETPDALALTPDDGFPGDAWGRNVNRKPGMQVAVMQSGCAEVIANGQPLTLFGDNLFLHLDLSTGNLPAGTLLQVGGAVLTVTDEPHNGCKKFRSRFGDGALRFVADPEQRMQNRRGIYMRVIEAGEVSVGDSVIVVSRPNQRKNP